MPRPTPKPKPEPNPNQVEDLGDQAPRRAAQGGEPGAGQLGGHAHRRDDGGLAPAQG